MFAIVYILWLALAVVLIFMVHGDLSKCIGIFMVMALIVQSYVFLFVKLTKPPVTGSGQLGVWFGFHNILILGRVFLLFCTYFLICGLFTLEYVTLVEIS